MSDEARESQAKAKQAKQAGEAADENQKLTEPEEQITKPAPKVKPQREKDPKEVAAGKKLAEKNRQAKAALERAVKREREIAEREQENENSAGWLPEMSFQTVLSLVGIAFTAFELYQRFRQKESSGSVQSPIYTITTEPRAEPKQSVAMTSEAGWRGAPTSGAPGNDEERSADERSADERRSEQRDNNLFFSCH